MAEAGQGKRGRVALAGIGGAGFVGQHAPSAAGVSAPIRPAANSAAHAADCNCSPSWYRRSARSGCPASRPRPPATVQRWI